jgi:hypothetical protein
MYAFFVIFSYAIYFYGFLIPEATIILIIAFFLLYWINKYNLFRRYTPDDISYQLTDLMLKSYEPVIILFALGNLIWHTEIRPDASTGLTILTIITLVIALAYVAVARFATRFF